MNTERARNILIRYRFYLFLFFTAFVARAVYWAFAGTQVIGDARGVLAGCDRLSTVPLAHLTSSRLLYSGYEIPYCLFLELPGTTIDTWVFVQLVLSSLTCVLLFVTGRRVVGSIGGWIAGLGFVPLWETFRWIVRPQSELLFTFLIALTLWQFSRYRESPTRRSWVLLWAIAGWMALTRPFGIPILLGFLLYDVLPTDHELRPNLIPSRVLAIVIFATGIVFIAVGITFLSDRYFGILDFWSRGVIVTGSVATYAYTPRPASGFWSFVLFNADHLIIMAVQRVLWVFVPVLPRWSTAHILLNLATVAPLIVGGLVGAAVAVRRRARHIGQMWLTPAVCILGVIGITYLDGGFNYRAQLTPLFALLTGYAMTEIEPIAAVIDRVRTLLSDVLAHESR